MRASIELIPRCPSQLLADARTVQDILPAVDTFNIPDLMRLPIRSWEACALTRTILPDSIPHIRAIDIAPGEESAIGEGIIAAGLREILVIRGDPPADRSRRTYPNTSASVISQFKRAYPSLRVYAAFDPYRRGLRDEMDESLRKRDAGADGFFTQPFFDLRLLEMSAELLRGQCVFWGIAPVVGAKARAYWETTNRIVFPTDFAPTLAWNLHFTALAVDLIRGAGGNVYFMPIRIDLASYLRGLPPLFSEAIKTETALELT